MRIRALRDAANRPRTANQRGAASVRTAANPRRSLRIAGESRSTASRYVAPDRCGSWASRPPRRRPRSAEESGARLSVPDARAEGKNAVSRSVTNGEPNPEFASAQSQKRVAPLEPSCVFERAPPASRGSDSTVLHLPPQTGRETPPPLSVDGNSLGRSRLRGRWPSGWPSGWSPMPA